MKKLNSSFASHSLITRFGTYLAATATVGMLALCAAGLLSPAHADPRRDIEDLERIVEKAQVAELDQLAADFHGAISYGGNITTLMSLWEDNDSISITLNGTSHVGRAAVQAFFLSAAYFNNNWVSLAPEYKTVITVRGDTATISTQCVGIDLTASPMVVKNVTQVEATCEKFKGQWLFTSMNNTAPAPL